MTLPKQQKIKEQNIKSMKIAVDYRQGFSQSILIKWKNLQNIGAKCTKTRIKFTNARTNTLAKGWTTSRIVTRVLDWHPFLMIN